MTSVTDDFTPTDARTDDDIVGPQDGTTSARSLQTWRRRTAVEMVVSGLIGLFASFVLSIEAWELAKDPAASLGCDFSSVISCSTVALSPQAEVLGFPNAFLGIAFECVVIAISVAVIAGVRFPRWYLLATEGLYTVALGFAYWLFLQSYFVIGALCPWCLLITVTTTLVWVGLTRLNVREGHLLPGAAGRGLRAFVSSGNDWLVVGTWLVLLLAAVVLKYGYSLIG